MKHLITIITVAFISLASYAQIAPIQTHENAFEFISGNWLYRTTADDSYTLQIVSSNQFEDKAVHLDLGHGAHEAIASLSSLFAVYHGEDAEFSLQGYDFAVRSNVLFVYHTGKLEYAAGDYMLKKRDAARVMEDLIKIKGLPIGDVSVTYYTPSAVFIQYKTYGFERIVNFNNVKLPLSRQYAEGEQIDVEDIALLKKVAENPNAYREQVKKGASIFEKEQLIQACNAIIDNINE